MISKKLPDPNSYTYETPALKANSVIYAHTTNKYYYPEHKTPFMFIGNYMNAGGYVLNNKYTKISGNYFYFLNINDELEISFDSLQPLQTLFIFFSKKFITEV